MLEVELPVASLVGAVLVLIPLPWHWRTRNICTISAIGWLAVCNLYRGISAIVWRDNVIVKYEVWCEIATRTEIGGNVGVPASIVCICCRLARAVSPYHAALSANDKRRRMWFEIGMCVILPIIFTGLHVTVQPYRYILHEGFGCTPATQASIQGLLIVRTPPNPALLVGIRIALRWLIHRRAQFQQKSKQTQLIRASGSYLRLVYLTIAQMTFSSVMSVLLTSQFSHLGQMSWDSWEDVHKHWREVYIIPRERMPEFYWRLYKVTWYFVPITSVTFFAFFGSDPRVAADYANLITWIKTHVFRIKSREATILPQSTSDTVQVRNLATNNPVSSLESMNVAAAIDLDPIPPANMPNLPPSSSPKLSSNESSSTFPRTESLL